MAITETELTPGVVVPEAVQPVETFTIPDGIRFKNMAEYAQYRVAARLGIYPDDHLVTQYAQQLIIRRLQKPDDKPVTVRVYTGRPNAFVFPTGDIFIADQILKFIKYEEEALFILRHEQRHHNEAHTERVLTRAKEYEENVSQLFWEGLAQRRIHEWGADIEAFQDLDRLGINPMGGIEFQQRCQQDPTFGADLIHGRATDRALNLRAITYIKDLPSLQSPLHDIPDEVVGTITREQQEKLYDSKYDPFQKALRGGMYFKCVEAMSGFNLDTSLLVFEEVFNKYKSYEKSQFPARFAKMVLPRLASIIWERLRAHQTLKELDDKQITYLLHGILQIYSGVDSTNSSVPMFDQFFRIEDRRWVKQNFGLSENMRTLDDVESMFQVLDPSVFDKLGLRIIYDPSLFAKNLTQAMMDNFLLEEEEFDIDKFIYYSQKTVAHLENLYQVNGTEGFNSDVIFQQMIDLTAYNLQPSHKEILLKKAEELKPSKVDIQALISEEGIEGLDLEDQVVRLCQKMSKAYEQHMKNIQNRPSLDRALMLGQALNASGFKHTQFNIESFIPELQNILDRLDIKSPQNLLVFLAKVRKRIYQDADINQIFLADNHWEDVSTTVIKRQERVWSKIPEGLEKMFYQFKIALLLAYSPASDLFNEKCDFRNSIIDQPDFNLDWYRKFFYLATDPKALGRELGIEITTAAPYDQINKSWEQAVFMLGKYKLLNDALATPRADFEHLLGIVTTEFPYNHIGVEEVSAEDMRDITEGGVRKRQLLHKIFTTLKFNLDNAQHVKSIYYLSTYLEDSSLAVRLQSLVWERLIEGLTFAEGFAFLEKELQARRLRSFQAVYSFIERKAITHDQIQQTRQRLLELATQDQSLVAIGKLLVGERFFDEFFSEKKLEILMACLGNGQDDEYFKRYLYRRWVKAVNINPIEAEGRLQLNALAQRLLRLDPQSKYVLLRDLLTGTDGVLLNSNMGDRMEFVNFFLDNYIEVADQDEAKYFQVIKKVIRELARTANYDLLYFALSPILQERILLSAPTEISWWDIIKSEIPPDSFGDVYDEKRYLDYEDEEEDEENELDYRQSSESYFKKRFAIDISDDEVDELYKMIAGSENNKFDDTTRQEYEAEIDKLLGKYETRNVRFQMSVNEFLLELAQKLGAPGVRFLQILGQLLELPPDLENSFSEVYDRVSGQTKITANDTLLREWPQAQNQLVGLEDRLGGGSLMSVFKTRNAVELAVKILNPNSSFHTDNTDTLLTQVFTYLAKEDPAFAPALTLLEDVKEWIKGDINFEGFLGKDVRFRKKHNGFNIGGKYQIKIPQTYAPENKYFMLEEFIEGTNLTQMQQLSQEGHDLQEIIRLVTKNFFSQLQDGLVLSDVHPGNIRIGHKNNQGRTEVTWLDRNYYLEFSLPERFFLWNLSKSLDDPTRTATMCANYAKSIGIEISDDQKERIIAQAKEAELTTDPARRLMRLSVILRREGIRLPLKMTLLIKNLYFLDRMAKKAGMTGIAEAVK